MINYVRPGDVITVAAPADVLTGAVVQVGQIVGFATKTALSGVALEIQVVGVFNVTKVGSQAWAIGQLVYWNGTAFTTSGSGEILAGIATEVVASGAGDTTGQIRLNGTARPDEA